MKLHPPFLLLVLLYGLIHSSQAQEATPAPPAKPPVIIDLDPGHLPSRPPQLPRSDGPPRVIGEGGGARLLHFFAQGNRMRHVPRHDHGLVVAAADGRQLILYRGWQEARMNGRGDVAMSHNPGLKLFFSPDYKPLTVLKLRSDRFLKAQPDLKYFSIHDVSWGEGVLVCSGHLNLPGKPTKWSSPMVQYPFLSRLFFDAKGEVRDHQILWTTWHPGRALRQQDYRGQDPAANSVAGSLHLQGGLLLWKNEGHGSSDPYPAESPQGFEKAGWQCTDMANGKTRPLGTEDAVDRDRLAQVEKEIEEARKRP